MARQITRGDKRDRGGAATAIKLAPSAGQLLRDEWWLGLSTSYGAHYVLQMLRPWVWIGHVLRGPADLHRHSSDGPMWIGGAEMCARMPSGPYSKSRVAGCRDVCPCDGICLPCRLVVGEVTSWCGQGMVCRVQREQLPGNLDISACHVKFPNTAKLYICYNLHKCDIHLMVYHKIC